MELDELKKSWNALDKHLQKSPVTDAGQLAELITTYRTRASKSLKSISNLQRASIATGVVVALLLMSIIAFAGLQEIENPQVRIKVLVFTAFIAITIIGGLWWDIKVYQWIKNIHVDEMPVVEVSRRITTFKRWTKHEVVAICIWAVLFNGLYYWLMNFYNAPALLQALIIMLFIVCDTLIIYLLYKKVLYKHLDNINKNIEELKDICTE